jgi:hypothetical protein
MNALERWSSDADAAWYAVRDEHESTIERWVVSTPGTRDVLNRPELLGVEFNMALHGAFGFNRHSSAFMSSQRYREEGRWRIKEDMYRKLQVSPDSVLVMGDVIATGVTVDNGLEVITDHLVRLHAPPRALVFFTVGCHKAEKALERWHERAVAKFPNYERTILVYIEAKLNLVDSKTALRIGIPGTDLIRRDALTSPELALTAYADPAWPLERCGIYDAGSRAFDIATYVGDVLEYWEAVADLARGGLSLRDALEERIGSFELSEADYRARAAERWVGVDPTEMNTLVAARRKFLAEQTGGPDALLALCARRRVMLRDAAGLGDPT